jgi:hypothetical protein
MSLYLCFYLLSQCWSLLTPVSLFIPLYHLSQWLSIFSPAPLFICLSLCLSLFCLSVYFSSLQSLCLSLSLSSVSVSVSPPITINLGCQADSPIMTANWNLISVSVCVSGLQNYNTKLLLPTFLEIPNIIKFFSSPWVLDGNRVNHINICTYFDTVPDCVQTNAPLRMGGGGVTLQYELIASKSLQCRYL